MMELDLHGEVASVARVLIKDFIKSCYNLNERKAIIIHGIGEGVLRKVVKEELSRNKMVKDFGIDMFNPGVTNVIFDNKDVNDYNSGHNSNKGDY